MPVNKNFAHRLEILDECLRNNLRNWDIDSLVNHVNEKLEDFQLTASKRTIQNDLKYLADKKHAPIERKRKGNKTFIYYSDPGFSIKNLPVSEEEIELLKDAIHILNQITDLKIVDEVTDIVNKLQNRVTSNQGAVAHIQFEKQPLTKGTEFIDNLFTAIKEQLPLRVTYQSFTSKFPEEFVFHPYLLKESRNRWYVIGRKNNTSSPRTYALDRIVSIKNSRESFLPNDLFDPGTLYDFLIGVTIPQNKEIEIIEIKAQKSTVPYLLTKPFHHTQEIVKEYKNGDVCFRYQLMLNQDLISHILGFGSSIKLLKPLHLKDTISKILEKSLLEYKK